jgi:hypothetical protein
MLTADGKPREDLWVADRVHPNHAGYLLRVQIMRPILGEPDKKTELIYCFHCCRFVQAHLDTASGSLSPPKRGEGWGEGI